MQTFARAMARRRGSAGFTAIELMVVALVIGLLAAIAIPNFIKFQARSKQSEAKANLKALYTAEKAYFQEKDTFLPDMSRIGFSPERGNRYAYYLDTVDKTVFDDRSVAIPTFVPGNTGISVDFFKYPTATNSTEPFHCGYQPYVTLGPQGSFVGGAQGNIDTDDTFDQWTISSISRAHPTSTPPPPTNPPGTTTAPLPPPPITNPPGTTTVPVPPPPLTNPVATTTAPPPPPPSSNTFTPPGEVLPALIHVLLSGTPPPGDCDADSTTASGEPENDWNDVNR